jgi:hypothetical protein
MKIMRQELGVAASPLAPCKIRVGTAKSLHPGFRFTFNRFSKAKHFVEVHLLAVLL